MWKCFQIYGSLPEKKQSVGMHQTTCLPGKMETDSLRHLQVSGGSARNQLEEAKSQTDLDTGDKPGCPLIPDTFKTFGRYVIVSMRHKLME